MTIRLYIDEDAMSAVLVEALRSRGVDVITALDAGMIKKLDSAHLEYASAQGRILYSYNQRDYWAIHTRLLEQGLSHAGIIIAEQQRYSIGEEMRRILRLVGALSIEEMTDRVEFLSVWG